jgi:hypothetical protein
MSIEVVCNNEVKFKISYNLWLDIKVHIIGATFEYLTHKFEEDQKKYGHIMDIHDPNYIGNLSSYYGEIHDLQYINNEIMKYSNNNDNIIIHTFLKLCNMMNCVNSFYRFDVGGLHTFCSKSEHGGYYSPGNSFDICLLLQLIKPFINTDNDYEYYEYIYGETNSLYSIFRLSYDSHQKLVVL